MLNPIALGSAIARPLEPTPLPPIGRYVEGTALGSVLDQAPGRARIECEIETGEWLGHRRDCTLNGRP